MNASLRRAASVALFAFVAACSTETEAPVIEEGTFVGSLDGSDALFAVTVADGEVVAYACGGALTIDIHTRWYRGTLEGDSVTLTSNDGATGSLTFAGDGVSGSLTQPGGDVLTLLETTRAVDGSATALFSVVDDGCRTGVIVKQANADEEPFVQGAWCSIAASASEADIFQQVTPITPIEAGITSLKVEVANEDKELVAVLVDPVEF